MKELRKMPKQYDGRLVQSLLRWLALLSGAVLLVAARPVEHPAAGPTTRVTVTADGTHLLGNPAAKIRLTEYISYTCPHCAHFNAESEATLRLTFVAPGKGSVEVRPYIRNPIDLAAALLVDCGRPSRFIRLHDIFLNTQATWMARYTALSDAQRARWQDGPTGGQMRAIAGDLGFYEIAENNGISRAQADHCLNDEATARRLAQQTDAASAAGVNGTPGFAIDGVLLTGTYDWQMLAPQLQARL